MTIIRRMAGALGSAAGLALALPGCNHAKDIQVQPEEWRTVSPGQPLARFPTARVIEPGNGPAVGLGHLVKVNLRAYQTDSSQKWVDRGDWWIWTGFRADEKTPFYTTSPRIASALIGLREGTLFDFIDAHDAPKMNPLVAGLLFTAVIGDPNNYSWRTHINGTLDDRTTVFTSSSTKVGTQLRILATCKADLQIRTVRLFDDSLVTVYAEGGSRTTREPREVWVDETRIQGKCSDGRTATFRYGPQPSASKTGGRSPVRAYFDQWFTDEWEKLPVGVQIDNNRPPVVPHRSKPGTVSTRLDTPVKINVLADARDPDGNRLTARIVSDPKQGRLSANADGSFTYTPDKGWSGVDEFVYKASDGMAESKRGTWRITVNE
ncbi:MAG: cadherin-like domain-containing protein [Burkholderiaceae bacterium]|nr:cadherin-like domain-containing protein [Burkholderiaceae bacterium]